MLKILLSLTFSFLIVKQNKCINVTVQRKVLKSLVFDLSIKNIIIINPVNSKNDLFFAKSFSQLNIFISFLTAKEMNTQLLVNNTKVINFVKTLVFLKDETNVVPEIFTVKNEYAVSKFIWISFNKHLLKESRFYVPYNTQLLLMEDMKEYYEISEIYHPSLDSEQPIERLFGFWGEKIGLKVIKNDLFQRRFNMNKTVITLIYQRGDKRFVWLECIEIIIRVMNFRIHIRNVNEYAEGASYKGKLLRPEIILTPKVFDYTTDNYPFVLGYMWKLQAFLFLKYDSIYEDRGISLYLRPFSAQLWGLIFISIITSAACTMLVIIIRKKLGNFQEMSFLNGFYHPFEAFTNQYGGEKPTSFLTQILITTTRIIALFIVPAYSAAILTSTLVPNIKLPFTDIKGFVQDGSYKLGFSTHDQYHLWFKHTNDKWSKVAYEKFLIDPESMPKNYWEEFKMLCEYKKVAFIFFGDMAVAAPCGITKIPTPLTTVWNGLYLRENSPYVKIFNRILKSILSSGVFNKNSKEIPLYVKEYENTAVQKENAVTIETITPILKLMAILYTIAGIFFLIELVVKKIFFAFRRRL